MGICCYVGSNMLIEFGLLGKDLLQFSVDLDSSILDVLNYVLRYSILIEDHVVIIKYASWWLVVDSVCDSTSH
jgi:hypothetical protein